MQVVDTVITDWQVQCSAVEQNNFQDLHPDVQNTTKVAEILRLLIRIHPAARTTTLISKTVLPHWPKFHQYSGKTYIISQYTKIHHLKQ